MTTVRHVVRLFAVFTGLFSLVPAAAVARDCSSSERAAANRQLWLSEADKALSFETHLPWGKPTIPEGATDEFYLSQRNYVILYDGDLRVPLLTAEKVRSSKLKSIERTDCFRRDPRINAPLDSKPSDYSEPIFDQGHLAAFANQTTSKIAGNNSFVMSNMAPQTCQFNRGIWQILEGVVRLWAAQYGTVYVFSGSIFDRNADGHRDDDALAARMTSNNEKRRVAVPTAFYKVVAVEQPDGTVDAITFVMPHAQDNPEDDAAVTYLQQHVSTLAQVLSITGLDLFPSNPIIREAQNLWPFDRDRMPNSLCHDPPDPRFPLIWQN